MDNKEHSSQTGSLSSASTISNRGLDLSRLPLVAILSAHLKDEEESALRETLRRYDAPLTTDLSRAKVFIGKVGTKKRAEFELRNRKIIVKEVDVARHQDRAQITTDSSRKRKWSSDLTRKYRDKDAKFTVEHGANKTWAEDDAHHETRDTSSLQPRKSRQNSHHVPSFDSSPDKDLVWVLRLDWLETCVSQGHLVPLGDDLVYHGTVLERPRPKNNKSIKDIFASGMKSTQASQNTSTAKPDAVQNILDKANADSMRTVQKSTHRIQGVRFGNSISRRFDGKSFAPSLHPSHAGHTNHVLQQTTSEYEGVDSDVPQPPDWVKRGVKYACQRFTPANGPNEEFLEQLRKIRTARILIDDEIGVRAYSTIIASIAAYPHKLRHPRELALLPGCDEKTAVLFVEWKNTGKIQAVVDYENDEAMKILRSFYNIWGVGAKTARHFYYNNHWTELDDIIDFGWNDLDRVQQIGVKYYEEFLEPIPRSEVEEIAAIVRDHAVRLRDEQVTVTIVGGYRRGKTASGDVDMVVSHPNLDATAGLIREIVESLEEFEWITHTLTKSLTNTNRGQQALPFRAAKGRGAGFDTLDKALVVWQDPSWPTREQDLAKDPKTKNPAIHRRVDIIVAPWRTVGCAIMGWSGGTTFQRDLRRYAKAIKGWKFDSSGVRSRADGEVVLLEGPHGVHGTPEDAEKAVFKGMGLEYIPPEYRVTY